MDDKNSQGAAEFFVAPLSFAAAGLSHGGGGALQAMRLKLNEAFSFAGPSMRSLCCVLHQ